MNNLAATAPGAPPRRTIDIVNASLKRRYARERRFRLMGAIAVGLGLAFVVLLFADIFSKGYTAFQQTYIRLPVTLTASISIPRAPGHRVNFRRELQSIDQECAASTVSRGDGSPRTASVVFDAERRRSPAFARTGDGGSQPDRDHPGDLGAGRRRCRHAGQGQYRPRGRPGGSAGHG